MRQLFTPLLLVFFMAFGHAQTISGELKKWHTITIEFTDDETYTETGTPNPFLDRRLNVTFTSPSNNTYVVPGYFAADGNAAETSATSGNKWFVKFSPDEVGQWSYSASFRAGSGISVTYPSNPNDGTADAPINGLSGNFSISASDKSGRDFRGKGRLEYANSNYPRFAETGEYFIKAGPDSPENLLGFNDFDDVFVGGGTDDRKDYSNHVADWQTGDPQWQGTKGRGLIGAINYLSNSGMNSISFLTMSKNDGDSQIVTTWIDDPVLEVVDFTHYDVSRLAQWEIVFSHAQKKGMFLHFKTQEQENAKQLNNGSLGQERKLYYRELVARFGHHLVLNWNMGEENESNQPVKITDAQRIAQLQYVADIDPYNHLRVVHSGGSVSMQNAMYTPLLGNSSELTGVSLQSLITQTNDRVINWVNQSNASGKPWVISSDETAYGLIDDQYFREKKVYSTFFGGAYGCEWYRQGEDQSLEDFRSGDIPSAMEKIKYALDFMNLLPLPDMQPDNSLISSGANYLLYKPNDTYAAYLDEADTNPTIDIGNSGDTFTVKWYDVRNGGSLQNGTITSITSNGTAQNIGLPPNSVSSDWVALITNSSSGSSPGLSINNRTVTEGSDLIFTVSLNNDASGPFTVDFSTADNSALAGSDYTAVNGTLNFNGTDGETQTITVSTDDDSTVESDEEFFVNLTNATGGVTIQDGQGLGTIVDNDTNASISINDVSITEGNNAVFTITLDNDISGGFTVDYATADISATSGDDYNSSNGSVTFTGTAGETQTITITTIDDSLIESDEEFVVTIASTSSVIIADDQGSATILDNDEASISIDNVTIDEGNNAVFTATLDNNVSGGFNLDFATADDSALFPADYNAGSGTLSFTGNAGETQTISISTNDDSVVEGSEQFFINLSNPTNGVTLADSQGTATITDNDSSSISINDVSVTEGGTATLTVSLSNAVNGGISVNYATTDNSAQAGTDYQSQSNTLNFVGTAGESRQISIATLDDFDVELIEDFTVDLSNITGALSGSVSFADNSGFVTVNDNDSAEIEISNTSAIEGSNLIFNVSLNHNVDGGVSVDYTTADITAVSGSDYTAQSNTLNFAGLQGETLQISVPTLTDGLVESSEQISVTLSNSSNPNVTFLIDTGTGTIVDSDTASVFINDNTTVNENGGQAVFTITLSAEVSGGFTIDVQTQDGTAVAGEDYTATSNTITFTGTAGETQQFSVPITDDAELESNEQFQVLLSNISNSSVQVSNGTATGVILDNDTASLSINSVTVTEGSPAVFVVTLNSAVATPFTVSYTTLAGTAFAGEDFESSTGTLNFSGSANETQTISINTIDDAVVESTENFVVELSNVQGAAVTISGNQGTATITDNDTAAAISINDVSITEGGNAVFTVTLDNAVSGGLTVDFATADNSATAPADYSSNSGTLTFSGNAGETQTITITTVDDTEVESNEQFFVNLSNATNGVTIADNQGIATLIDNDAAASVSIDDISITEGNNAVFTVTLNNDVSGGFSLDFATADDSALAPADYNAGSGTLSFTGNAGETQTITITTIDDTEIESNEQFFVNLTNATNGVTIADNQGVAVINDNEEENPVASELSIQETAAEEGTIMVVPVSLNQAATEIIELEIVFENITTTDTDFETSPVTVLFDVGQISSEIRIPVFNDGENEEIETFRILVGSVLQGEILNPEVEGIASILDQPELIVYPVPLIDNQIPLSLTGMGNGTFFLLVMESSGKTLISQVVEISENQYEINLPSTLANGIYLLNLQNADTGTEYSKKFALNR